MPKCKTGLYVCEPLLKERGVKKSKEVLEFSEVCKKKETQYQEAVRSYLEKGMPANNKRIRQCLLSRDLWRFIGQYACIDGNHINDFLFSLKRCYGALFAQIQGLDLSSVDKWWEAVDFVIDTALLIWIEIVEKHKKEGGK